MSKKICFAASSGGHLEQIMMLKPLMEKYESFLVTERTQYVADVSEGKVFFLHQVNRKELFFFFWLIVNSFKSLGILVREKPNAIVTTGVLAMIPLCLLAKLFHKKLIYIESFAVVDYPTKTGRFLYRYADRFYVQWKSMLKWYPNAIYLGGIY